MPGEMRIQGGDGNDLSAGGDGDDLIVDRMSGDDKLYEARQHETWLRAFADVKLLDTFTLGQGYFDLHTGATTRIGVGGKVDYTFLDVVGLEAQVA